MRDIADIAGATTGAVSVTLNGATSKTLGVSAETRERILRVAKELGYRRDMRASSLAGRRNNMVGLMLPYDSSFSKPDPFFSMVTSGVCTATAAHGYNLVLYSAVSEENESKAMAAIDRRIDGLILLMPPDGTLLIEECSRLKIRTVLVLQTPDKAELTVNSDDYAGGRLATQHLLELGHRRIAHLLGSPNIHTSEPRYRAYADALHAAGIQVNPDYVRDGRFSRDIARASTLAMMRSPTSEPPTAIFAANDISAHGAIDALTELGLAVPHDISVVGYDDTWYAGFVQPALTSVNMNVDTIGRLAAQMLIQSMDGNVEIRHPVLPVSLTVRASSGPVPSASSRTGILQ